MQDSAYIFVQIKPLVGHQAGSFPSSRRASLSILYRLGLYLRQDERQMHKTTTEIKETKRLDNKKNKNLSAGLPAASNTFNLLPSLIGSRFVPQIRGYVSTYTCQVESDVSSIIMVEWERV